MAAPSADNFTYHANDGTVGSSLANADHRQRVNNAPVATARRDTNRTSPAIVLSGSVELVANYSMSNAAHGAMTPASGAERDLRRSTLTAQLLFPVNDLRRRTSRRSRHHQRRERALVANNQTRRRQKTTRSRSHWQRAPWKARRSPGSSSRVNRHGFDAPDARERRAAELHLRAGGDCSDRQLVMANDGAGSADVSIAVAR